MQKETIESALALLNPSLEADGFKLNLESIDPRGTIRVVLEAKEGACLECLVPDEILNNMIKQVLQEKDIIVQQIVITKEVIK